MRYGYRVVALLIAAILVSAPAWADQIMLKDGRAYSGKFVRGDASVIEFRILNRVETFKVAEVDQIIFKEPELQTPQAGRTMSTVPAAVPSEPQNPPVERNMRSMPQQMPAPQYSGNGPAEFPAGTTLTVRMEETVDTDRNRAGDTFRATVEDPLLIDGRTVVPRGSEVKGRIARSRESGRISGQSELILELTDLTVSGRTYPLSTSDYTESGSSRGKRTAATAGGVAALGAIVGAIAGGGKGAAIGAASGAAVGTGAAVLTRGQVLHIPVETILDFKLQRPLTISTP